MLFLLVRCFTDTCHEHAKPSSTDELWNYVTSKESSEKKQVSRCGRELKAVPFSAVSMLTCGGDDTYSLEVVAPTSGGLAPGRTGKLVKGCCTGNVQAAAYAGCSETTLRADLLPTVVLS
jgi:hypothetical protein